MSHDPDEAVVAVLHAAATLWVDTNRQALARTERRCVVDDEAVLAFGLLAERAVSKALDEEGLR